MVNYNSRVIRLHTYCQKPPQENTKDQVKIQSCIKKVRKEYLQETISLLSLPANSDVLTHMPREVRQEVILHFFSNVLRNM